MESSARDAQKEGLACQPRTLKGRLCASCMQVFYTFLSIVVGPCVLLGEKNMCVCTSVITEKSSHIINAIPHVATTVYYCCAMSSIDDTSFITII